MPNAYQSYTNSSAAPFDAIAAQYDATEAHNAIMQWMRERVQRAAAAVFAPQSRLLEIGCGTGTDALFFAQRGHAIVAAEPATEMLAVAAQKIARAGCENRVTFVQAGVAQMPDLIARFGRASFAGLFSNFGAINCARELDGFAKGCLQLLEPEGKLVLCFMPPVCPWEILYYFLRGRPNEALRRLNGQPQYGGLHVRLGARSVKTYYHAVAELQHVLEERFEMLAQFALGVLAPPPYLAHHHWLFRATRFLDEKLSGWPLLRNAGDHVVFVMQRR